MKQAFLFTFLFIFNRIIALQADLGEADSRFAEPYVYQSVNVITGEYCESNTDLLLEGPHPLAIRRFYNACDQENSVECLGWHFNQPNLPISQSEERGELEPGNKKIHYAFDEHKRLKQISTTDLQSRTTYNSVNIHYSEEDGLKCVIEAPDGRNVCYSYRRTETSRIGTPYLIDHVALPGGVECRYDYCEHPSERKHLITRRTLPEGRYLEMDYYGVDEEGQAGLQPGQDPLRQLNTGKVKRQRAPHGADGAPVAIYSFVYGEGFTEVADALNHKTIYRYGKNKRLTAIESFLKDNAGADYLYRVERLFWKTSHDGRREELTSRAIEDGHGNVSLCRCWDYDPQGAVARETLYGNLTGKNTNPIILKEDGRPCTNGVEHYSTIYQYTDDAHHFLTFSQEDNGAGARYLYDEKNQRLKAKLSLYKKKIVKRHFYTYDTEGLLVESIIDDGASEEASDLNGVTERQIVCITPAKEPALFGLPSLIEEKCFDCQTGEEQTVKLTLFHYSSAGKVLQKTQIDPSGTIIAQDSYSYDQNGRQISVADEKGNTTVVEYDANGNKKALYSGAPDGSCVQTRHLYDYANRLIRTDTCDAEGGVATQLFRYDEAGNKIAEADSYGNETQFIYDALGRMVQTCAPAVLDGEGNLIRPTVKKSYDIHGNLTLTADAKGYETKLFYNARGKPVEVHYPDGTCEKFEYSLDGLLQKSIAKNGAAVIFHRDEQGRVRKTELQGASGEVIAVQESTYNAFRLLSTTDPKGAKLTCKYDSSGRPLSACKEFSGDSALVEYEYDRSGRVAEIKSWCGEGALDYALTSFNYGSENAHAAIEWKNPSGEIVKSFRQGEENDPPVLKTVRRNQFYNERGQNVLQIEETDSLGNCTITTFDALGRAESKVGKNCLGVPTYQAEFRYDAAGNKVKEIYSGLSPGGHGSAFVIERRYGPNNRLERLTEGVGTSRQRSITYAYGASGVLESVIKADGVVISYGYNAAGKLLELFSSDGSVHYKYRYDGNFSVAQVDDLIQGTSTVREYGLHDQPCLEILGNGLQMRNRYDKLGRRVELTLPDNSGVLYQYDAANLREVQRVSAANAIMYTHSYTDYSDNGALLSAKLIGSLGAISYSYDHARRLTGISTPFWSEIIPEGGYDLCGNMLEVCVEDSAGRQDSSFQYDGQNRLAAEEGSFCCTYAFDSLGNRISQNGARLQVDGLNQLVCSPEGDFYYDINGNMIEKKSSGDSITFSYDALDRLIRVAAPGRFCSEYTYDAFDRRLKKDSYLWDAPGQTWKLADQVSYLYDGENEIGSVGADGRFRDLRILGTGMGAETGSAIALELGSAVYAPIHDHRGSVCCLLDLSGCCGVEYYRYSAFGEQQIIDGHGELLSCSSVDNPWGFASKRLDPESGLVYFGKRFYSPKTGRWLTEDPLGYADGPNRFAFLHNNPMTHIDLYGLFSLESSWQGLWSFCQSASGAASQAASFLQSRLSYQEYIREDIEDLGHKLVGKVFLQMIGYYAHPPEAGVYGHGELNDNVRITLVNGILCIKPDFMESIKLVSETHGGVNVHYIFRPTEGWARDLIKSFMVKCGFVSEQAQQLAGTWKRLIQEMGGPGGGGLIIHYAHSIGGTDTYAAKHLLTPDEQKMIKVYTLGSATMIPNHGFQTVVNFVSRRDGVTLLDPIGRLTAFMNGDSSNIIYIGSHIGIPFIDHLFDDETYRTIIEALGNQFLKVYGTPSML